MKFEIGKYYQHSTGSMLHILCRAETTLYGETLIAEQTGARAPITTAGETEDCTQNFEESTEEEWMKNFSK